MFCMRTSRAISAVLKPVMLGKAAQQSAIVSAKTFTTITSLRPTTFPTTLSAFRTDSLTTPTITSSGVKLDILPKISESPSLASTQVRCGPRDTYDPSHFVRKRRHGFLSRIRTRKGRTLLKRRKAKGRKNLSH